MSRNDVIASPHEARSPRGRNPGRAMPMMLMVMMYMPTATIPGSIPAMNNLPMSCSVIRP
jgi:hypothetical protein